MPAVAADAVRVDYPKRWFAVGAGIDIAAMGTMLWLAADSIEPFARTMWTACALLICVPLLFLFVPPIFTCHHVGEKGVRLRMGILINATIPFERIVNVSDAKVSFGSVMVGIGVKYVHKKKLLFVTASFRDLVSIYLDGPQEIGAPLKPLVQQVVLTVKDREGFMALVKDRARLEG